jgi:hypothetical protein
MTKEGAKKKIYNYVSIPRSPTGGVLWDRNPRASGPFLKMYQEGPSRWTARGMLAQKGRSLASLRGGNALLGFPLAGIPLWGGTHGFALCLRRKPKDFRPILNKVLDPSLKGIRKVYPRGIRMVYPRGIRPLPLKGIGRAILLDRPTGHPAG